MKKQEEVVVVDKHDRIIGTANRSEVFKKNFIRRISRMILIKDGKIFMQKRSDTKTLFPGCWDQSAGGHVDKGETYLQCAKRELSEELGVSGVKLHKLGKIYFEEGTLNEVTLAQFATVYIIKYEDQPIIIDTDEISEGKWMSLDEIEVMIKAEPEKLSIGFLNVWKQFKQLIVNFS